MMLVTKSAGLATVWAGQFRLPLGTQEKRRGSRYWIDSQLCFPHMSQHELDSEHGRVSIEATTYE